MLLHNADPRRHRALCESCKDWSVRQRRTCLLIISPASEPALQLPTHYKIEMLQRQGAVFQSAYRAVIWSFPFSTALLPAGRRQQDSWKNIPRSPSLSKRLFPLHLGRATIANFRTRGHAATKFFSGCFCIRICTLCV